MHRFCQFGALICAILIAAASAGCIAGVHHHRIQSSLTLDNDQSAQARGQVNSVDLGVVADFRYFRLALPFEGHRRQIEVEADDGSRFGIDQVVELRALRLDVPLFSFADFSEEPSGRRYPGRMRRRHSLEIWGSASVGMTPINTSTASVGLVYYRYNRWALRLYGGASVNPVDGVSRRIVDGAPVSQRRHGYAPGAVAGLEITLAAGEYGLELIDFFVNFDSESRQILDRWQ